MKRYIGFISRNQNYGKGLKPAKKESALFSMLGKHVVYPEYQKVTWSIVCRRLSWREMPFMSTRRP